MKDRPGKTLLSRGLLGAMLVLLAACAQGPSWYEDVKPISDAYCADCHASGIAPFGLTTAEQWTTLQAPIEAAVTDRVMPPFYGARGHTTLRYDTSLSDDEIAIVTAWFESGAALGRESREGEPITVERGGIDGYDVEFQIPEPYAPTLNPDDYHCFVFDWPETESKYVYRQPAK